MVLIISTSSNLKFRLKVLNLSLLNKPLGSLDKVDSIIGLSLGKLLPWRLRANFDDAIIQNIKFHLNLWDCLDLICFDFCCVYISSQVFQANPVAASRASLSNIVLNTFTHYLALLRRGTKRDCIAQWSKGVKKPPWSS